MLNAWSRRLAAVSIGTAAAAILSACSLGDLGIPTGCAGVGYFALDIAIRDPFGQPQALGAKVTLTDGAYSETAGANDTLHILAAGDRGGRTYDVHIAKPFYRDTVIRGVQTRGGGCVTGHENPPVQMTVPVTLSLAAGAPSLREIHILPRFGPLLDRAPNLSSITLDTRFDADPGVSRSVTWAIAGDTALATLDSAAGTVSYRCGAASGAVLVTARAVANPAIFDTLRVRLQGHPIATGDPAC